MEQSIKLINMDNENSESASYSLYNVFLLIALLLITVFGIYSALTGYLDYNSDKAEVEGTVVSSDVDRDTKGRGGVSYNAEIEYEYTYKGQNYTNDNLRPGTGTITVSKSRAESLVSNYSEGEPTTIHIDRADPSRSWLLDKLPTKSILTSALISFVGLGAIIRVFLMPD